MRDRVIEFCNKRSKKETEDSMKTSRKTSFVPRISYLPDYNTFSYDTSDKHWFEEKEGRFWCPIKKHVIQ